MTTNIQFEEVNVPFDSKFIDELGKQYAQSYDYSPSFLIKTTHEDEEMIMDDTVLQGFRIEKVIREDIFCLKVSKITNGWIGIVNGHFSTDYENYTVTHITKLDY